MSDSTTSTAGEQIAYTAASLAAGTDLRGAGPLLSEAMRVAGDLHRVDHTVFSDPRDGTKAPVVISHRGIDAVDPNVFTPYRLKPIRRTGVARHTHLDSFIAHIQRFKAEHSAIFASDDPKSPHLQVVFDYHPAGDSHTDTQNGHHRGRYEFPLSEQWKTWSAADGQKMSMSEFAIFLEDNIVDVVADATPSSEAAKDYVDKVGGVIASPSKLIEISRNLQVNESSQFREARNLSSGEAEILFTTQHTDAAGAKLVLPNLFMICIPVFARSDDFWQIFARFRYRKNGDKVIFWFELWRVDLIFETAFTAACEKAAATTELPLFFGAPEV